MTDHTKDPFGNAAAARAGYSCYTYHSPRDVIVTLMSGALMTCVSPQSKTMRREQPCRSCSGSGVCTRGPDEADCRYSYIRSLHTKRWSSVTGLLHEGCNSKNGITNPYRGPRTTTDTDELGPLTCRHDYDDWTNVEVSNSDTEGYHETLSPLLFIDK